MNKRNLISALALACLAWGAQAQGTAYPNKPVRLVVGFAPGGAADYVARAMSDAMGKSLGQTVIVENRAGAGSSIAAENVAKAAPDGYTVLLASPSSISVNPALNPKLNYTPKDLVPVTKVTTSPLVLSAPKPLHRWCPVCPACRKRACPTTRSSFGMAFLSRWVPLLR
jgi:tripartite-type tricarboxylate transporter receptor subunit TctC